MHGTDQPHNAIDTLLDGARVLAREYDEYRGPGAGERIDRAKERRRRDAAARTRAAASGEVSAAPAPARYPGEHEQARYELDLAAALVLNAPQSALCLARLVDDRRIEPEGALVFACLLHLTGRDAAARFWWQFAAGGGSHTAAYCLYLHHRYGAEFRDADYWRRESSRLRALPRPSGPVGEVERPLLSECIRRDLLAQCHRGSRPQLPSAVELVINRLSVDCDDLDFGEIPQPSAHLAAQLAVRS